MAKGPAWREQETEELKRLVAAGYRRDVIAIRMDRPRGTIDNRIALLGLGIYSHRKSPRDWTAEELARAEALRSEGKTYREIGVLLGRHSGSVKKKISEEMRRRAARGAIRKPSVLPIAAGGFIRPPTRAQLMAGR